MPAVSRSRSRALHRAGSRRSSPSSRGRRDLGAALCPRVLRDANYPDESTKGAPPNDHDAHPTHHQEPRETIGGRWGDCNCRQWEFLIDVGQLRGQSEMVGSTMRFARWRLAFRGAPGQLADGLARQLRHRAIVRIDKPSTSEIRGTSPVCSLTITQSRF
jgi:hypothetical protein